MNFSKILFLFVFAAFSFSFFGADVFADEKIFADDKIYDVIVIGAGISGLSAADALTQLGYDVVVFEAKDRLGGRLWTDNSTGTPLDLGASWIHGIKNNPVYILSEKYDIETVTTISENHGDARAVFANYSSGKNGTWLEEYEEKLIFDQFDDFEKHIYEKYSYNPINELEWLTIDPLLKYNHLSDKSVGDVLTEYLDKPSHTNETEKFEAMAAYWYTNTWAADFSNISARHYAMEREYSGEEVIFPGGYFQIIEKLSSEVDYRTKHVVTEVDYSNPDVLVKVKNATDGSSPDIEFKARFVLSTVPLGVLKDSVLEEQILENKTGLINFIPALDARDKKKVTAIDKIGMGVMNKAYLIFDESDLFWSDKKNKHFFTVLNKDESEWALFLNLYKYLEKPALLAFNSGSYGHGLENLEDDKIKETAMVNLRYLYPGAPEPIDYKITRWASDPYTRGSYSYPKVDSTPTDFRNLARNIDGKLFFAGEATVPEAWGTVHGAYLSGIRAANEIDFWHSWQTTFLFQIVLIGIGSVILIVLWVLFLRWKTNKQIALAAMGRPNEIAWRSTVLIAGTILFVMSAYYFTESQFGLPPDVFDYVGAWDDECYQISQLMEAVPYMKLSVEEENMIFQQSMRCNGFG